MKTARQVAIEILTATEAGKTVQCRPADPYSKAFLDTDPTCWHVNDFEPSRYEWRVKPEPREFVINIGHVEALYEYGNQSAAATIFRSVGPGEAHIYRKFREVLD